MNKYPLLLKIGKILYKAADRVAVIAEKTEALPDKIPEIIALIIYAAAHLGMAVVHEPFFDEAEAWQIARSVTLKTLFLETTHYEGHPPLWHLILMPFAKAGASYELTLTLVSLAFMGTTAFLILRYAPFPRLVRLLLPFTYFFFYQYGVISRVYCVLTLLFVLLAMAYRGRNKRPGRYVAVLILMCLTLAYGLVFAGGLAMVWLWEIWKEGGQKQTGRNDCGTAGMPIWKRLRGWAVDRRIWWLAALLAAALVVIWMIMPRPETYAIAHTAAETSQNPVPVRLLYTLFVLPADTVLTDVYSDHITLPRVSLPASALLSGAVVGLLIWYLLLHYGKRRGTVPLLLLPYGLFAGFSAVVYLSIHHIGIGLLYFVFWSWATLEAKPFEERTEREAGRILTGENAKRLAQNMTADRENVVRCAAILLGTLAMVISLFWTGAACALDSCRNYAPGRKEAAFIRKHHLERYRMMSGWLIEQDSEGNVWNADINECDQAVNLAPYFEHNLFFNFNGGRDDRNYITHIRLSEAETRRQYENWRQGEVPQVLWMSPDLSTVYGEKIKWQDYVQVYRAPAEQVWKAGTDYKESTIWVRRELLEETGLRP